MEIVSGEVITQIFQHVPLESQLPKQALQKLTLTLLIYNAQLSSITLFKCALHEL